MLSIAFVLCAVSLVSAKNPTTETSTPHKDSVQEIIQNINNTINTYEKTWETSVSENCERQADLMNTAFQEAVDKVEEVIENLATYTNKSMCVQMIVKLGDQLNSSTQKVMNCLHVNYEANPIRKDCNKFVQNAKSKLKELTSKANACNSNLNATKNDVIGCTRKVGAELIILRANLKLRIMKDRNDINSCPEEEGKKFQAAVNVVKQKQRTCFESKSNVDANILNFYL